METKKERYQRLLEMNLNMGDLNKIGIPQIFAKDLIRLFPDKFKTELGSPDKEKKSEFIHGETGTGKTLYAIASALHHNYCSTIGIKFVNVAELLYQLRQTYSPNFDHSNFEYSGMGSYSSPEDYILKSNRNTRILILDDLGVETSTDFALQVLYLIVNYRYENELRTIVTSNYSTEELYEKVKDGRIISRIAAMGDIIKADKIKRA